MASRLDGVKPLFEPFLNIGHWTYGNSEIVTEIYPFAFKKMHLKMLSGNRWSFCLGLNVLKLERDGYSGLTTTKHNELRMYIMPVRCLKPRKNGRHLPDDIFKRILLNGNVWISITISLKFVPKFPINIIPTLVQINAWRWTGDKLLSEPIMSYFADAYMLHSVLMS